jgi:hypothetical protein
MPLKILKYYEYQIPSDNNNVAMTSYAEVIKLQGIHSNQLC